jgi:hypothetical protein
MNGYRHTHKADNKAPDGSIPCCIRLEGGVEWQGFAVDSLSLHAGVEANVREGDSKPGQETCDGRHVGKPVEHLAGARLNAHKRQEREC